MSALDDALATLREDLTDSKAQSVFYDLFLNSSFFVPTLPDGEGGSEDAGVLPLIIDADGIDYLMLFDSKERLEAWAGSPVSSVVVPGHVLAATSAAPLHWALNVGSDFSKQFLPEEIDWLRDVVARCEAAAAKEGGVAAKLP